ncbi:MAG: FAD-binding oxidoreductase [bacterium]
MESKEQIRQIYTLTATSDSPYLQDESHLAAGEAAAVYFPEREEDVSALLAQFHKTGTAVTVSGARTGVVGGAVPHGGVVLVLERMNRILGVKRCHKSGEWLVQAEPGVILRSLQGQVGSKNFEDIADREKFKDFQEDVTSYFYPPDPTEGTATLGGTVAANSSGARSLAYGSTRNYVQRLRVVLATGEIVDISRGEKRADKSGNIELRTIEGSQFLIPIPTYRMPEVKSAAGYFARPDMDPLDLFIGAEGTLGVITYLELRLLPKPANTFSGIAFFPDPSGAVRFAHKVRALRSDPSSKIHPIALEYFDEHSLFLLRQKRLSDGPGSPLPDFPLYAKSAIFFEQFYPEGELEVLYEHWQTALEEEGVIMDDTWGGFDERELEKMKNFRHALPDILNEIFRERKRHYPSIHKISADIAVPESSLDEMLNLYRTRIEEQGLEYVIFGHIGECHLHLNILPGTDEEMLRAQELSLEFATWAVSRGGTISAEHGIGKLKHRLLEKLYGSQGIQEMVRIKLILDPKGILNRGNVFPENFLPYPGEHP